MRKITEIYEQYKIMPHLQMHQFRVAAVAKLISDSLNISIDEEVLVKTCLLHDMGNVIKFDLSQTKSIFGLSEEEVKVISSIKQEFIDRYGSDEHQATVKIIKKLNLNPRIADLADKNRFSNLCIDKDGDDMHLKLIHYADSRVGPHSVISYDERMNDAGERYKNHPQKKHEGEREKLVQCGREIENQIFTHSNIKPEDITDESVAGIVEELKNFEI